MKYLVLLAIVLSSNLAFSSDIDIKGFNAKMTEISDKGLDPLKVFNSLNTDLVKTSSSICANRAHIWTYDLKRFNNVDSGKIFLFYTKKDRTGLSEKTWWYHVAPVVSYQSEPWVVDAGFPGWVKGPLRPNKWLEHFTGSETCKEIETYDQDLLRLMFKNRVYPKETIHGVHKCYYIVVPATYWWPAYIAQNLLGEDEKGEPINFTRETYEIDELYSACLEASAGAFGQWFGTGVKKCMEYYGITEKPKTIQDAFDYTNY
ncbi:MAG: protein-glutamine glutaminase family protein [Bacteriovoracaceae bacterium]